MTNRDRWSDATSSVSVGLCAINMSCYLSRERPPYDVSRISPPIRPDGEVDLGLLRVELHDELLLHGGVDDLPRGQPVHEDAHPVGDDLEPGRHGALAGGGAGHDERGELEGALADLDDVVLAHPVAGDVDLDAVDQHVAVPHELAGGVTRLGEPGPVDDVVEPRLEDAQQVLAGLPGAAVRLFVVAAELLLEDAVDARRLLLLAHLEQVLALLGARAAVLTRRVGPDLDRALRGLALGPLEEQLGLLPPAALAVGAGVTRHRGSVSLIRSRVGRVRRGGAWADGNRCGASG